MNAPKPATIVRSTLANLWLCFALSIIALSCTGPDDGADGAPSTSATNEGSTSSTSTATSPTSESAAEPVETPAGLDETTTVERPTTMADYERLWAGERQAIIDRITSGEYGLGPDGLLRGPGDFTLDTNDCPPDWSDTEGISDGTVAVSHLAPLSSLTTAGDLATGAALYLDDVNERGGIGPEGLRVDMTLADDAFVAANTRSIVEKLVAGPQPFAVSTIGTWNLEAVNDLLNEQCIPTILPVTFSPMGGDPVHHPWTTALGLSQSTEAMLWVEWIETNLDGQVSVAALVMDNSFGWAYQEAFEAAATTSSNIEWFESIRHDPATASLEGEVARLAELEPDVFISMTAGNPCLLAMQEVANTGLMEQVEALFTPSVCQEPSAYMSPAGQAADGWLTFGGGVKDSADERWSSDPYVSTVLERLQEAELWLGRGGAAEGYALRGWAFHQIFEIAANLEGGLSRTNIILAQRGLSSMTHPMLIEGVHFGMDGTRDAFFIEGSELKRFDVTTGRWITEDVVDANGQTPLCHWLAEAGCR